MNQLVKRYYKYYTMDYIFKPRKLRGYAQMNRITCQTAAWAAALALFLSGCSNKEIQELQSSVGTLENRLEDYQQNTVQETQQTTSALGEISQTLNNRFLAIQNSVQQVSNRVADLERSMTQMQQRLSRLEEFTSETSTLTQDLSRTTLNLQNTMNTETGQIKAALDEIRSQMAALKSQSEAGDRNAAERINSVQSALDQRITQIESNNREIYEQILSELGAEVPETVQPTSPTGGSQGSQVYTVKSGDSLSKVASQFGVSLQELQRLNGISDPSKIFVGQEIQIP